MKLINYEKNRSSGITHLWICGNWERQRKRETMWGEICQVKMKLKGRAIFKFAKDRRVKNKSIAAIYYSITEWGNNEERKKKSREVRRNVDVVVYIKAVYGPCHKAKTAFVCSPSRKGFFYYFFISF